MGTKTAKKTEKEKENARTQATKETDIEFIPMGVKDFVTGLDKKETIFVGSGSGYFFIGDAGTFLKDLPAIDDAFQASAKRRLKRSKTPAPERALPLGDRVVRKYYRTLLRDGKVIIIEGKGLGGFWTEREFRSAMKASGNSYARAYRSCCGI